MKDRGSESARDGLRDVSVYPKRRGLAGVGSAFAILGLLLVAVHVLSIHKHSIGVWIRRGFSAEIVPPTVNSVVPGAKATGVHTASTVTVKFDKPMKAASINSKTIYLQNSLKQIVPAKVSYDPKTKTASLTARLEVGIAYLATVKGGPAGVVDTSEIHMESDFYWTFSTVTYGGEVGGPGGPLLILANDADPFGRYYAEILLAEGLNAFSVKDVSSATREMLARYQVIILGPGELTAPQVGLLSEWVQEGGNLIAMRPDKKLAGLLGLADAGGTISNGYIQVDTSLAPGRGIVEKAMQFHGKADLFSAVDAQILAALRAKADASLASPAVTLRSVGAGKAAAFTYDLARSVVLTRQGNPEWADQDRDGQPPVRSDDLFFGAAVFDSKADWVDPDKIAIPQADEQQRLLANMITIMNVDRGPMPRFWYFPRGLKGVVVMTGDDHATAGTISRFNQYAANGPFEETVPDWEAVRATSYVFPNTKISNEQALIFDAQGFEIGLHLNSECRNATREGLRAAFVSQLAAWRAAFPGLPSPSTHRMHCIAWSGYTVLPEVGLEFGIRLDTSYYYWPASWVANKPGLFTGSGMPMRFATDRGKVIDVYQAATQMTDESGQRYPETCDALLDRALGAEGYYGAFVANMHTDLGSHPGSDAIVASALKRGVPIISARQLLNWIDARNSSFFSSIQWENPKLTFSVKSGMSARGLQAMVPIPSGSRVESLLGNGVSLSHETKVIKGIEYAVFQTFPGDYEITFALKAETENLGAL